MGYNFKVRIGNLELRSCDKYLMHAGEQDRAEIVKFSETLHEGKETCYVVAYYEPHKEGFDFRGVGERILELFDNPEVGRKLVSLGFELLKA